MWLNSVSILALDMDLHYFIFIDKNLDNEETDAITNHINILNSASFPLQWSVICL